MLINVIFFSQRDVDNGNRPTSSQTQQVPPQGGSLSHPAPHVVAAAASNMPATQGNVPVAPSVIILAQPQQSAVLPPVVMPSPQNSPRRIAQAVRRTTTSSSSQTVESVGICTSATQTSESADTETQKDSASSTSTSAETQTSMVDKC